MKVQELFPIGSVVKLRNGIRPLMIFGIKQTNLETNEEYDYIGVLYPEGNNVPVFRFFPQWRREAPESH